jgi:ATP-dependent Lon protease
MSDTEDKLEQVLQDFINNYNKIKEAATEEPPKPRYSPAKDGNRSQPPKSDSTEGPHIRLCSASLIEERISTLEADSAIWKETLQNLAKPKRVNKVTLEHYQNVLPALEFFNGEHANFAEPSRRIASVLKLAVLRNTAFQLRPILLYGPPGCGKSRWVKYICSILGLERIAIDLSGTSDFLKITGNSRSWKHAGPGEIAKGLAHSSTANPVIVFDEIDKTYVSQQGNPLDRLLMLTEKQTAQEFNDDFVEVPLDASHCSVIAMANSIDNLPAPFLSRFECIPIEQLDYAGRITMVQTVYRELLEAEDLECFLRTELDDAVVEQFARSPLAGRELKAAIHDAVYQLFDGMDFDDVINYRINKENYPKKSIIAANLQIRSRTVKSSIGFLR